MALIQCAECQTQVSDQAAACPKCGAPIRGNSNPPSVKEKKKTSPFAWVALVVLLAGIGWYLQSREFKEQSLPAMPVEIGYRSAMLGPGLVLQVKNTSDRHLSLLVKLTNPSTKEGKSYRLDAAPKSVTEVGHKEGWVLASGDSIELFHNDYHSWRGSIP